MDFDIENKTCSFCGVRGTQGAKFAGGLGAMMCVPCVEHFHDVFSTEAKTAAVNHPPWEKMSDAEILSKLPLIAQERRTGQRVPHRVGGARSLAQVLLGRDREGHGHLPASSLGTLRAARGQAELGRHGLKFRASGVKDP